MMNNLRHFKLVDKDGYFSTAIHNKGLFDKYSREGIYSGFIEDGALFVHGGIFELISESEFQYFEEVFEYGQDYHATNAAAVVNKLSGKDLEAKIKAQDEQIKKLESEIMEYYPSI